MEVGENDRVLLLALPALDEVRAMAERASGGIVVGIAAGEAVHEARRALRDCPNVMITPEEPGGLLPWRDDFFTVASDPGAAEPSRELLRVLQPGGTAWVAGGPVTKR